MSGIAKQAGVTRALVYHYFPDKAALFEAVLRAEADALLAATRLDATLPPLENIRRAISAYLIHFSPASDKAPNLHAQADAQPAMTGRIRGANHAILAQRVTRALSVEGDALTHAAIVAWLEFVTALARETSATPDIDREAVVDLSVATLRAIVPAAAALLHQAPLPGR